MSTDQELLAEFDREVGPLLAQHKCPGLALALLTPEETHLRTYGYANVADQAPITESTLFQVCSISKAVASWGVMHLVEQGLLDLDAPVERYLTRWSLPDTGFDREEVTARRLLSHTAGISVDGYSGVPPDAPMPTLEDILDGRSPPLDEVQQAYCRQFGIDPASKHPPVVIEQIPGSVWNYSGGGYMIIDLLMEELSGMPAAEFLDKTVLAPLGMQQATFQVPALGAHGYATAYDDACQPVPQYRFPHCSAGGMSASIAELARFVRAECCGPACATPGGGVLSSASLSELMRPVMFAETAGPTNYYMGLGHFLGKINGHRMVQHSGGALGWRSIYFVLPDLDRGIAILINGTNGNEVWQALARMWVQTVAKD